MLVSAWKVKDLRGVSLPQAAGRIAGTLGISRTTTWSLSKLAEFLVAEGVVDDISHEGLRVLLRHGGVTFQRLKTWKTCKDPDYAVKKARIEHLYAIADGEVTPEPGEPEVIFCIGR
jgi:hypothetical protein